MNYLNERLVFTITPSPTPSAGMYKYVLLEYDDNAATRGYKPIFHGNFYYSGSGSKTFDCTDIIRNRKSVITPYTEAVNGYLANKLVRRYAVGVYFNSLTYTMTDVLPVVMIYSYPNLGQLTNPDNVCFNGYDANYYFTIANQGFRDGLRRMELIPHYPLKNTTKYNYMQALYIGQSTTNCWIRKVTDDGKGGIFGDYLQLFQQGDDLTSITYKQPLGDFIKGNYADYWSAATEVRLSDISVYQRGADSTGTTNQVKVAIIDNCTARYYLQWQDRLGGFQSQPLNDNITYSESFDNETVQDYRNVKRNSTIGIKSKWKLSTGWIDEKIYPIYESILVSPYLVLYDELYDKAYNVICTGDWTEKTFKNQKKLLDITFNFEADSKQNIIY